MVCRRPQESSRAKMSHRDISVSGPKYHFGTVNFQQVHRYPRGPHTVPYLVDLLVRANRGSCSSLFRTCPGLISFCTSLGSILRSLTDQFPILKVPACMDRNSRKGIEARGSTKERVIPLGHKYATGIRMEAWKYGIVERRIGLGQTCWQRRQDT